MVASRRKWIAVLAAMALAGALGAATRAAGAAPAYQEVRAAWKPSEAYLLDRHGEVLQQVRMDLKERRLQWTSLDEISPAIIQAVLRSEDKRFYAHSGVDWAAVAAASLDYIVGNRPRGASTISMQVAALLAEPRVRRAGRHTLRYKIRQIRAALELEKHWSKNEILEAYLNLVTYRGELRGVAAATQGLFGKRPSGVTETEALVLVSLLPSPTAPAERVAGHACAVARRWTPAIACEPLRQVAFQALSFAPAMAPEADAAAHVARRMLGKPGERVVSSLDATIQRIAIAAVRGQLQGLGGQNVRDGAVVVVDNATGEVLAYVGSGGEQSQSRLVDGVRASRQAGSTLKPFLYATALERGYLTAASLLEDSPINVETSAGLYIPQNYDREFKGIVSVRTALASSLNVPAVRTLVLTGVDALHGKLKDLGYESLTRDAEYYGYALALGSPEVTLLEQVNAYRTLANGGLAGSLRFTPGGSVGPIRRVMSQEAAFIVSDILSDPAGRSLTFGLANVLATPYWTAVKTGTSKSMRDNWCIGYSSRYTVGVWVGNFEGDAMWDVSGVTGAAPIWLEMMNALHQARPSRAPTPPRTLTREVVRFNPPVEPDRPEWFAAGTATSTIRLASPKTSSPRIQYPANGMIIALDPDIPTRNQSILFQSNALLLPCRWVLDGVAVGAADAQTLWVPTPGHHRLVLAGGDGTPLDEIGFQVRGSTD